MLNSKRSDRGFAHVNVVTDASCHLFVAESSSASRHELWVGGHSLGRTEVVDLVERLSYWLVNGRLKIDGEDDDDVVQAEFGRIDLDEIPPLDNTLQRFVEAPNELLLLAILGQLSTVVRRVNLLTVAENQRRK